MLILRPFTTIFIVPGLGPAGLPPFTPTPYETGDFPSEPSYVTSAFVRDSKRGQKLSGDFDNAWYDSLIYRYNDY